VFKSAGFLLVAIINPALAQAQPGPQAQPAKPPLSLAGFQLSSTQCP
jgi:hypothetical protein